MRQRNNFLQSKAFSIMAPAVSNSLSPVTKISATITTFKAHLKTEPLLTTRSNISFAAGAWRDTGASNSNSSTRGAAYACF